MKLLLALLALCPMQMRTAVQSPPDHAVGMLIQDDPGAIVIAPPCSTCDMIETLDAQLVVQVGLVELHDFIEKQAMAQGPGPWIFAPGQPPRCFFDHKLPEPICPPEPPFPYAYEDMQPELEEWTPKG